MTSPYHMDGEAQSSDDLAGCQDSAVANRRADELVQVVAANATGDFWSAKASQYLAAYLCAGALAGGDMHLVARWVRDGDPQEPESILMAAGARRLAADLSELRSGRTPQAAASVRLLMREAISLHA